MAENDVRTGTWVTYADGAVRSMQVRRSRLTVVSGPDTGLAVEMEATCIRVGAQAGCDLVLSDRMVSGHHLEILLEETGYRIRDLDSTNGTFVGGHRVRDAYLNPGTIIYLGNSRLRFDPLDESVTIELAESDRFGEMVGQSVAMRALFARLAKVAPTDASVLITGETGTGKELVAEALHHHSGRSARPFVVVDCGSIPEQLIASELFGHERGAFTGATQAHAGAFERANGGTVFLDEIGELPLDLQPNLLGVLERRQVRRIGAAKSVPLDIRVVAATNRDLASEMNRGAFRSDLFYRLAVVQVRVPSLRERPDDIPILAQHFFQLIGGGTHSRLSQQTLESLRRHTFPGNVRELRNVVERSMVLAEVGDESPLPLLDGGAIDAEGGAGRGADDPGTHPNPPAAPPGPVATDDLVVFEVDETVNYRLAKQRLLNQFDARYLKKLLARHGGNVSQTAREAGLDRMTVHKMLQRLGLGLGSWRGS